MARKPRIWILIFGVLVFSTGIFFLIPLNRPLNSPIEHTRTELRAIYMYLAQETATAGMSDTEFLDKHVPSYSSNYSAKLAVFLHGNGFQGRFMQTPNGPLYLVDAWGNPFLVLSHEEGLKSGVSPSLLNDNSLVIWSCGPNGVNEYGHGDDISRESSWKEGTH